VNKGVSFSKGRAGHQKNNNRQIFTKQGVIGKQLPRAGFHIGAVYTHFGGTIASSAVY
jgi:hypothetical protein